MDGDAAFNLTGGVKQHKTEGFDEASRITESESQTYAAMDITFFISGDNCPFKLTFLPF